MLPHAGYSHGKASASAANPSSKASYLRDCSRVYVACIASHELQKKRG